MSTTHWGAPGANDAEQVLVHPVTLSVTVRVKCIWKPGAPQSPDENVMVCDVLELTMAHPGGLPSTANDHEKLNDEGLKLVPMV